jgi:hypothetical protein
MAVPPELLGLEWLSAVLEAEAERRGTDLVETAEAEP